ncbi:MAG: EAL and HDOD domain-containing protein [Gemmatimonadaceae bacterium]
MDVYVARQPIFNTLGAVVGYELLYREGATHTSAGDHCDRATMSARTIVSSLVDIGLSELVGSSRAWINIPEAALVEDAWSLLDRASCVIEVLETVPVTDETMAAVQRMVGAGYEMALDDFVHTPEYEPFLSKARMIKLDVLGKDPLALEDQVRAYRKRGLTVLAERIETQQQYQACVRAGFELFQGYYFARPEVMTGVQVAPQVPVLAQAINKLADEEFNVRDLEQTFQGDPSLTYKLLRIANSAAHGNGRVDSVRKAIAMVGRTSLRRWLVVLLAASGPQRRGEDSERFRVALERARFAELVMERIDRRRSPTAFLAGLLSMLDVVLGVPLEDIISTVNVSDEVRYALLDRLGPFAGPILLSEHCELGLWEAATGQAIELGLTPEEVQQTVLEAARWTRSVRSAI